VAQEHTIPGLMRALEEMPNEGQLDTRARMAVK
jgi:hypothetical protein